MRRQYLNEERSDLVDLVRSGRATTREAAEQLGVKVSTAYGWVQQAVESTRGRGRRSSGRRQGGVVKSPTFVRLVPTTEAVAPPEIAVRVGSAEIQVRHGFDAELLRAVVGALGGGAT